VHQARLPQHPEVLGDGRAAGPEGAGELGDRPGAGAELIEERPPGGVGNGTEDVGVSAGAMHRYPIGY